MTIADVHHLFRILSSTHWVAASGGSASTGGVVVLISKAICQCEPVYYELERGRVLQVICMTGGGRLDVFVVHNFGAGGHAMRRVATAMRETAGRAGHRTFTAQSRWATSTLKLVETALVRLVHAPIASCIPRYSH